MSYFADPPMVLISVSMQRHESSGDALNSSATAQEALWEIIITTGIAEMRNQIMVDHDVGRYVFHFFCFWGPVNVNINYSVCFSDDDSFHGLLWTCFTSGLAGQVAYLNHDLWGLAGATAWLYLVVALAHAMVMEGVPKVRLYGSIHVAAHVLAMGVFVALLVQGDSAPQWRAKATLDPFWGFLVFCAFVGNLRLAICNFLLINRLDELTNSPEMVINIIFW